MLNGLQAETLPQGRMLVRVRHLDVPYPNGAPRWFWSHSSPFFERITHIRYPDDRQIPDLCASIRSVFSFVAPVVIIFECTKWLLEPQCKFSLARRIVFWHHCGYRTQLLVENQHHRREIHKPSVRHSIHSHLLADGNLSLGICIAPRQLALFSISR